ncbi:BNR repeat protein [Roseimicrobium gellanilyticum]|uniref:BNR repeat protein n=1 Tax=Roseimicrobium gellanilyticum TaxID=748857 RepID=A0A366H3L8_9BACT|nr:sialidase family protein [Roseimicrobium gellanilyticum]RBP35864.1 BNR repeat protein [Roseimicrobium gellanilyticum]
MMLPTSTSRSLALLLASLSLLCTPAPLTAANPALVFPAKVPATITEVNAPVWVGRPPTDAGFGLVRLVNGEIRAYDYGDQVSILLRHQPDHLPKNYIVSLDNGLTWDSKSVAPNHMAADARSPVTNEYVRLITKEDGVYAIRSKGGMDGQWSQHRVWETKVRGPELGLIRPAVFIREGKRILAPFTTMRRFEPDFLNQVGSFYSDDEGATWQRSNLVAAPPHKPNGRDKSVRWQNEAYEPTFVELKDGRVWMLFRTSQDTHYESFSENGGATWSEPQPSPFYGTLTMPTIRRLRDGKLLFLWNNTTPLPEFVKNAATAPYLGRANDGQGEDMFTNRDVIHAAISSDDGKTWHGFRELYLNPARNDRRYAETGGIDRSVHQSQAVEVAEGRVLVALGQHWLHRSLVLFNPAWLEERERSNSFANDLDDWSVQGFLRGIRGHCALNRFESCALVPHPDSAEKQALLVKRVADGNAMYANAGAVWNFPAAPAGTFEVRIRLQEKSAGARLSLIDRWLNPTDPTAHTLAMGSLQIKGDGTTNVEGVKLTPGQWHTLTFKWAECAKGTKCEVQVDGQPASGTLNFGRESRHGISYAHFQSAADEGDEGFLIESVRATVTPPPAPPAAEPAPAPAATPAPAGAPAPSPPTGTPAPATQPAPAPTPTPTTPPASTTPSPSPVPATKPAPTPAPSTSSNTSKSPGKRDSASASPRSFEVAPGGSVDGSRWCREPQRPQPPDLAWKLHRVPEGTPEGMSPWPCDVKPDCHAFSAVPSGTEHLLVDMIRWLQSPRLLSPTGYHPMSLRDKSICHEFASITTPAAKPAPAPAPSTTS